MGDLHVDQDLLQDMEALFLNTDAIVLAAFEVSQYWSG